MIVEKARSERHIPGATVVVEHRGHLLVARAYGLKDVTVGSGGYMTFYPAEDLTIIVLANSGSPNAPALDEEIARVVFRAASEER